MCVKLVRKFTDDETFMKERVFNFSAGPAVLPEPVLAEAQRDLLSLPGVGASILEISHRSSTFEKIIADAEANLRKLLAIPDDYAVLFLQGGARLQFSMIPMNLMGGGRRLCNYMITGAWSKYAAQEAVKFGEASIIWDGKATNYDRLPAVGEAKVDPKAAYLYYASNETIQGVQFQTEPDSGEVPLVCDASSDFLSRPLDVKKYGILYACAQKNAGPSGVTVVIMRKDLLQRSSDALPGYLNFHTHAEAQSLWNTAPTFAIYILMLVTKWLAKRRRRPGEDGIAESQQVEAVVRRDRFEQRFLHGPFPATVAFDDERVFPAAERRTDEEIRRRGREAEHDRS